MDLDKQNWNEEHPDLFVRLSAIFEGLSLQEEIRIIKIVKELLKTKVSLKFIETLFLALQENDSDWNPPDPLLELESYLITIDCDIKKGRATINDFIKKIEELIAKIEKT